MKKILYLSLLICLLVSCKNHDKRHLVGDFYSYTSLYAITEQYKEEPNEFHDVNNHSLFIDNFEIFSIKTTVHLDFYDKKLMGVMFKIDDENIDIVDEQLKNQVLDKNITFEAREGDCFINPGMIGPVTGKCYMWYDERLLEKYDKIYHEVRE